MRKINPVNRLARALAEIASAGAATESKAVAVIALTKGIADLKEFDRIVREAYAANGWNTTSGRPAAGNRRGAVPATVKQYVSLIRACFRLELPVASYKTFHTMRKAVKAARKPAAPVNQDPRMAGLRLVKSGELIGAPFHDLTVLFEKSAKGVQRQIAAEVTTLVRRFQPAAALTLAKAA